MLPHSTVVLPRTGTKQQLTRVSGTNQISALSSLLSQTVQLSLGKTQV